MERKWYESTWLIVATLIVCGLWRPLWYVGIVIGAAFLVVQYLADKKTRQYIEELRRLELLGRATQTKVAEFETYFRANGYVELEEMRERLRDLETRINETNAASGIIMERHAQLANELNRTSKDLERDQKKLTKIKELYKGIVNCLERFLNYDPQATLCKIPEIDFQEAESLAPSVALRLHALDVKDLRKAFRENEKNIESIFKQYEGRYTSKANRSLYALTVIALRAELQAVLINLRGESIDKAIAEIKKVVGKAMFIAGEGNQSILPTLTKFIGQIEHHFVEAAKIEHLWYIRKEQARQEQIALRAQMRQEAKERKELEEKMKKVMAEESKYQAEIERLRQTIIEASPEQREAVETRIREVELQLGEVAVKKDEIANLQNGKAGTVYVISNLGAFGENVFKVGMTRRLEPQERIDDLGDASVPFEFDVHSFIFSQDAVSLEHKLHTTLEGNRINKINRRKEFFRSTIDDIERLVQETEPTAEFNRTMLAEEYRASLEPEKLEAVQETSDSEDSEINDPEED